MNFKQYLLEKTRKDLLLKQKRETPERVKRANSYSVSDVSIDSSALLSDWLVITTNISGNGHTYTDSIAFKFVMTDLIEQAKKSPKHLVNSKLIIKSIHESLDKQDIYIDCSCQDFIYRYSYWSTKDKFKWGKLQSSNGKQIRNPHNDIGCMCKHLYALLRSNKFLNLISDKIMRTIMANLDILVKKFDIDISEFVVNSAAYDKMLRMNIYCDKSGKFRKDDESTSNDKIENQEEKTESIDEISTSEEVQKDEKFNSYKLIQYFANETVMNFIKEYMNSDKYIEFVKCSIKKSKGKESRETYLINNVSCDKLLELLKAFDSNIADKVLNRMADEIYNI